VTGNAVVVGSVTPLGRFLSAQLNAGLHGNLQEICKSVWAFLHFWHFLHHLESVSYRFYWPGERPIPSLATTF
jgi:hypothetical protein